MAESVGFSEKHGGRQVCNWTRAYIKKRVLPTSARGHHTKVYSLLSNPEIAAELCAYLHSNLWASNSEMLQKFTQDKLFGQAAEIYVKHITEEEMPRGLKEYMEIELLPRIHR